MVRYQDSFNLHEGSLSPDQQRRLDLLLARKRLGTAAKALGGAPSSVVFQKLLQANSHEHGLGAAFIILRDYIFAEKTHPFKSANECVCNLQLKLFIGFRPATKPQCSYSSP